MSGKDIASISRQTNNINANINEDSSNKKKSFSPEINHSSDFQSFSNIEINQRNFPSKANYFGNKGANKKEKDISPGKQSPLLNYYASLSPKLSGMTRYYSPENHFSGDNNKHSPSMGGNIGGEQTFNFSPSTIFNRNNQRNNNIFNTANNHPSGEVVNKSLAEKMEHLVVKNDENNTSQKIQNNEQKSDDEEENENDEMYMLTLDICDDKENEEEIHLNNTNNNNNEITNQTSDLNRNLNSDNIPNYMMKPINDNNIINPNNFINNDNIDIKNMNEKQQKKYLQKNNNEEINKKSEMAEKMINNSEFPKPYIPNKYRNNIMEINQINSFQDDNMLPSYGGPLNNNNGLVNNFTINNNINNNFNFNNNIINNNLLGNSNFNMGGYNNLNNYMYNQGNNLILMNNNIPFQMMKEKDSSPYPTKIGEFLPFQNCPNPKQNQFNPNEHNKFEINNNSMNNNFSQISKGNFFNNNNKNNINNNNNNNNNSNYINFYYNGDSYQTSQFKKYKNSDNSSPGQFHSINSDDYVIAITSNNKKVKRIDPNVYLNESLEFLAFNIFPLAKDQAGCRFLQEKLEKERDKATNLFFNAIIPHILSLIKDPFGNYLIQKLCNNLNPEQIKKILEKISTTILDIGSNNHGTRVIQHLINFLKTKTLLDYFLKCIEPFVIPLLKELNGTHIIQQLLLKHPKCSNTINKIIVENCASLASHSHGCCVLQKFLSERDQNLKESLINNLINNCLVLIIDQYGNYVIQSILLLNEPKSSSAIAMKILDNVAYYSKHRYSSNVVEKCFDFCGKNERKKLAEKLSPPDILADLIMDEHGNYVIQKALSCSGAKEQETILNNIIPLIPKIRNVSFGEKLISRLMSTYPQFKSNLEMMDDTFNNLGNSGNFNFYNYKNSNNGYNNYKKGNKKKKGGKNNNNYFENNVQYNNNYYNNDNNMYFNNDEGNEDNDRNNNFENSNKSQNKNWGNKKYYKNRKDLNDDQKKQQKNNFDNENRQ